MLSFVFWTVVLAQNRLQLVRLLCSNSRTSLYLSLVTNNVFRIAFVASDRGDMVKVLWTLLTLLTCSNRDCFHMGHARVICSNK